MLWCLGFIRLGCWGQGDTEAAALADITAAMTDVIHYPWEDGESLVDYEKATAEMANLMQELSTEGISHQVHQVSIPVQEPTGV